MIRCTCPACRAALELPDHLAGVSFHCPSCQAAFTVPKAEAKPGLQQSFMDRLLQPSEPPRTGAAVPFPPPTGRSESHAYRAPAPTPPTQPEPAPPPEPRRQQRYDDWDEPRRPFRERDDDPYGDDDLDFDARPRAGNRDTAIRAAFFGMLFSTIGLFGILIGIFVFFFFSRRGPGGLNFLETITLVLAIGSMVSFALTLMGIVFSSRGLDRSNDHNRGLAVAGLVLGILGIVLSILFGSFYFLCGMIVRMGPV